MLWDQKWPGPTSGTWCAAGLWVTMYISGYTVRWKCQYDLLLRTVLTLTPLLGWFLMWEAFCLSQKIIWGTVRNWIKENISGLQIHTHKQVSNYCPLGANEQLVDLSRIIKWYEHSIQSVEQCDAAKPWSNANQAYELQPWQGDSPVQCSPESECRLWTQK